MNSVFLDRMEDVLEDIIPTKMMKVEDVFQMKYSVTTGKVKS
jgi:hypothetical protein